MYKWVISLIILATLGIGRALAQEVRPPALGVHILHPGEITDAAALIKTEANRDQWTYVTLPLSHDDLERHDEWQAAFTEAKKHRINPIVRLTSRFDPQLNAWSVPTRGEIIQLFHFLSRLEWPQDAKFIIAFNEPNHASEWGGQLDPAGYAKVLNFITHWAHTEHYGYRVLPAAMDLAAPNGPDTMEAFGFLDGMLAANPHVFDNIDYWNSHSYPNPAFSASPERTGQNSLRGYQYELAWLQEKTGLTRFVFITETGWDDNRATNSHLASWYAIAREQIWSDTRILGVTPFVLRGDPGPFAGFTLIDRNNFATTQYEAYAAQIDLNAQNYRRYIESFQVPKF